MQVMQDFNAKAPLIGRLGETRKIARKRIRRERNIATLWMIEIGQKQKMKELGSFHAYKKKNSLQ